MNYLKAVFWDLPALTNETSLRATLRENRRSDLYLWILGRFLEYGRVVDTFRFFPLDEIAENLPHLRLSEYARQKWNRLLEVYGKPQ